MAFTIPKSNFLCFLVVLQSTGNLICYMAETKEQQADDEKHTECLAANGIGAQ
jgi:hypothetical protein